ncbi:MAG: hypothetical protein ABOK23_06025 [Candidatus Methanoperedens sp.]|nr:hypothetical protein [Candidatus Methanoperedens sp.]
MPIKTSYNKCTSKPVNVVLHLILSIKASPTATATTSGMYGGGGYGYY